LTSCEIGQGLDLGVAGEGLIGDGVILYIGKFTVVQHIPNDDLI